MVIDESQDFESTPRRNKALYGFYYATEGFAGGGIAMFLSLYLVNYLGFSSDYAGLLLAIGLSPSYLKIVYGLLSDSVSVGNLGYRRPYVLLSIPLIIGGWLLFPFATSAIFFVLIIAITTLGVYIGDVAVDAWAIDVTPKENRGSMMGIGWGSQGIATVLGVLVTALAGPIYGYATAFLILGTVSGLGGIVWFVFAKEKPVTETRSIRVTIDALTSEFKYSYVWIALLAFLGGGFIFGVGTTYTMLFFTDIILFDQTTAGLFMLLWSACFFVGGIVGGLVYDKFTDYRKGVYVLAPSYVITLFLFGLNQPSAIEIVVITTALFGIASGLTTASIMGFAMNITPKAVAGTFFALVTSVVNMGQNGLANPFMGYMTEHFNYPLAFTIGALVAIPIIILVKFIVPPWKRDDIEIEDKLIDDIGPD